MLILSSQITLTFPQAFLNLSFAAKLFIDLINVNLKLHFTLLFYFLLLWNCPFFSQWNDFPHQSEKENTTKEREYKENTRNMKTKSKVAV